MLTLTRGDTLGTGSQTLTVEECGECGVLFAFPDTLRRKALADHSRRFYCPNGHNLAYLGKTEAQKLREQLDRERERSGRIAADRDQIEATLRATRGVVTKMRKRAAAGVCPCCHRTVSQLAAHMASKHPGYEPRTPGHLPTDAEKETPSRVAHRDLADRALVFLQERDRRFSEIRSELGITDVQAGNLLARLVAAGEITRVERGLYRKRLG